MSRPWPVLALVLTLFFLAAPPCPALAAPELSWRKVAEIPHDPGSFTQGLLLHQGKLYESTGLYGRSELRRLDPATGKILGRRAVDSRLFGEGLALHGNLLYQLTWKEGKVLLYNVGTLAPAGELPLTGEGWGLAAVGGELVRSDGSNTLYFHEPAGFALIRTLAVTDGGAPVTELNELEAASGFILANVWHSDKIAVISPADGAVAAWLDLSALRPPCCPPGGEKVLNGIAYDPATARLWVTGKFWTSLYCIEVDWRKIPTAPAAKDVK